MGTAKGNMREHVRRGQKLLDVELQFLEEAEHIDLHECAGRNVGHTQIRGEISRKQTRLQSIVIYDICFLWILHDHAST